MNASLKLTAPFLAAAALVATAGASATTASRPESAAALKACRTADLKWSKGHSQGAAGSYLLNIVAVNKGPRCKTYGYPGVTLLKRKGKRIRAKVTRVDKPHHVRIAHGGKAHFVVQYGETEAAGFSCVAVRRARVIAPDDTRRKTVRVRRAGHLCHKRGHRARLFVHPIRPGTKGT